VRDVFTDRHLAAVVAKAESRWARREIGDLRTGIIAAVASRHGQDEAGG
jgi:hypothetical protein